MPKDIFKANAPSNNELHVRTAWVDAVKLFACFLVVFGHLYMSMASSGLLDGNSPCYQLPIQTIYSFHVPLFFVCSGFLYQVNKAGATPKSHIRSIKRKALALGVPYVAFSSLTLLLKNLFSSEVNNQATPFVHTLLFEPIAPYWYLYTLFLLFCLIPRMGKVREIIGLFVATLVIKLIYVSFPLCWGLPDLVQKVASCAIWFAFGMLLSNRAFRHKTLDNKAALAALIFAITFSFLVYRKANSNRVFQLILAMLFVYSIISFAVNTEGFKLPKPLLSHLSQYFMPVYVLHTICAAGIRSVLLRLGIDSLSVNIIIGLAASIAAPMAIYRFSLSHPWALFFFEPAKAMKMEKDINEQTN